MLMVYGELMPLRLLEEIRFWKTQEKEHTVVIRTLVPTLEPQYVKTLKEWEIIFEKTEMAAQQWIEWALRTQKPADAYLQQQLHVLLQSSRAQSEDFIKQLLDMEQNSKPIQSNPTVKTVVEHIIRESEYFLGVLQALSGSTPTVPGYGVQGYATEPAIVPAPDLAVRDTRNDADAVATVSNFINLNATGESSWSEIAYETSAAMQEPPARNPVPIGGHKLPPLPYPYEALEPHIDAATMKLHHDKHHQSYVDGLNKAEKMLEKARINGDYELIKHWERELAFHGAGHYLHTIFWNIMSPAGGGPAVGPIEREIRHSFGNFERFKQQFSAAADKVEGGGWTILVWSPRSHRLEILQAEKHQNLSQWDVVPLLVLDVWEHAYYLKYKNERAKYIEAWWKVVNWKHVNERFEAAKHLMWTPY